MGFNMNKLMQQAQKMQKEMARVQEELAQSQFSGTAGGGVVTAVVNGASELVALEISPEIVDPEDVEMLEDMVMAAVRDAMSNAQNAAAEAMGKVTGGKGMPGMPGMF